MESRDLAQNSTSIELDGFRLYLNPEDQGVSDTLAREHIWEALETQLVKDEIHEGDTVLDIGANIGYYTLLFSRIVGEKGRVFSFEPDPTNFALLERNVATNGCANVTLVQKAVSNKTGETLLYLSRANRGDHRIYRSIDEDREAIVIRATTLDAFFGGWRDKINFIKMDIQGAEGAALEGMTHLLEGNRHVKILTEFWPVGLTRFGTEPGQYLASLLLHGFNLYQIDYEERVERISIPSLLAKYTVEGSHYTSLFCTRMEWLRTRTYDTLGERLYRLECDIEGLIPRGHSFILVDEEASEASRQDNSRRRIPFLDRNGKYWGLPADDETAIRELERLRKSGATFMVFTRPSFWWLDYYTGLTHHLRSTYGCVLENERLAVFDLRT